MRSGSPSTASAPVASIAARRSGSRVVPRTAWPSAVSERASACPRQPQPTIRTRAMRRASVLSPAMNQSIRFHRIDGRRLAYATVGDGPLLVLPTWWVSHLEEDWATPASRTFFETLAARHTVVRYDRFGVGLSDRERAPGDGTLGAEVEVLGSLLAELGADPVILF